MKLNADLDQLKAFARDADPFPYIVIDNFLTDDFARKVSAAYPPFDQALKMGRTFTAVNEMNKVQITDAEKFPADVKELHRVLAAPEFLAQLSHIFGINDLIYDDQLNGGGIHQTGARGRLDVHIDFNKIKDRDLYRRLNILIYFNAEWEANWGGDLELWDAQVKNCVHSFAPAFNRCVVFETSDISYHGVKQVTCPAGMARKSFAAYYYTREAPPHYKGKDHTTVFKARPSEKLKGLVWMPLEKSRQKVLSLLRRISAKLRG